MSFNQINVEYIKPNRTQESYNHIETGEVFHIYNYEGVHFRLFQNQDELDKFWGLGVEPALDFECEKELDNYLELNY